jgi:hypothetical protein
MATARPGRFNNQEGLGVVNQPVRTKEPGAELAECLQLREPAYKGTFYNYMVLVSEVLNNERI